MIWHRAICRLAVLMLLWAVIQLPKIAVAQTARVSFARTEAMIPMRDGVKLQTVILTPQTQGQPLPILMTRTPYGVNEWTGDLLNLEFQEFVADGYTFVFQDIRGKFESEGQFVMVRLPRDKRDSKSRDESTDTYDTIDWLIKNVPRNNARVFDSHLLNSWRILHETFSSSSLPEYLFERCGMRATQTGSAN